MAVEIGLQVPRELGLDGEEGGDHDGEEKPSLEWKKKCDWNENILGQLPVKVAVENSPRCL